jgi:hypothetical protein
MKKNIRYTYGFIICCFVVLSVIACNNNEDNESDPPYNNSYIQKFTAVDQITVTTGAGILLNKDNKTVSFIDDEKAKEGFCITVEATSSKGYFSADAPKQTDSYKEYIKYIDLIRDAAFKQEKRYYGVLNNTSISITDTIEAITVTSDKAFNENLSANQSLTSIITVVFDDPYSVVKNGYRNYEGVDSYGALRIIPGKEKTESFMIKGFPYAFVGYYMSDITWRKKPFIGNKWLLIFTEKPQVTGTHKFKISVTKTDGKILEAYTESVEIPGKNL